MRRFLFPLPVLAALFLAAAAPARAEEAAGPKFSYPFDWKKLLGTEEWGGLYMTGKKCGWMHSNFRTEKRDGQEILVYTTEMHMTMKYQTVTAEATATSRQEFSAETGELLLLESRMAAGPLATSTRVEPEEESFRCTATVGGKSTETKIPRCKYNLESVLSAQILAAQKDAKPGDELSVEMLMPESASTVRVKNMFKGRQTIVFRGIPTEVAEISAAFYKVPAPGEKPAENPAPMAVSQVKIDNAGRMVEGQLLGPFTFRMESKEDAKRMDAVSDVMLTTGVSLDKPIARPRSAKEAVLRISGMPEEAMVTDSRQKFEKQADDSFLLTLKAAALPEKSPPLSDAEREKLAESLAPTAFLQSDDPRLKKKSAEIVGGQKDAGKAAALLCDWVFRNVAKEFTPALSNALDTLTSLKGDCGEHTALYVALCRAAGIPAREVAGLAYAEGKLGGHAWAEVYAGGQWVAVDPTFGQHAADALHIKVAEGGMSGIEGMIRLADLMGKIKVQVVSSK